jgi:hypothetical protein
MNRSFKFCLYFKKRRLQNAKTFSASKSLLKHLLDFNDSTNYKLAITDNRIPQINGIQLYQVLNIKFIYNKMYMTVDDIVNEISSMCSDVKLEDILKKSVRK